MIIEHIITIACCVIGTMITRFLPFIIFKSDKPTPKYIVYLGKALPQAVFAMLIVYCIRNVDFLATGHGIPEIIGILVTSFLHIFKRQMLLSIAGGTVVYMILVQTFFA